MNNTMRLLAAMIIVPLFTALQSCEPLEQQITKAEAARVAAIIENSIARSSPKMLDNMLDIEVFAKRIVSNTKLKADDGFKRGVEEGLKNRRFGSEIIHAIGSGGSYKLVRQYSDGGKQHLLFRMYGSGGLNYHDYELVKTGKEIKAADILIYFTGEKLSETLGDFVGSVSRTDQTRDNMEQMREIRRLITKQQYKAAQESLNRLPASMRNQKLVQIVNVQICSGLGDNAAYVAAIEEYQKKFPDQANIPLLMIDAYLLNEDYPKALSAVGRLDKQLGTDSFLDYYRGLVHKMAGDTPQYQQYITQAYKSSAHIQDVAIEMINVHFASNDKVQAAGVIKNYRSVKSFNQDVLNQYLLLSGYNLNSETN